MIKRCPTCNRTYTDESLNFCLADGAFLNAPDDPQPTVASPAPRDTESPTEILPAEQLPVNIGTAPSQAIPDQEKIARKQNFLPWLIAGALAAAFVIYLVIPKGSTPNSSNQTSSTGGSPGEALKAYYDALKRKDIDGIKKYLSHDQMKGIEDKAKAYGETVDQFLREFADYQAQTPKPVEFSSEKINGNEATIEMKFQSSVRGDNSNVVTIEMIKEDGSWKLQSGG